MKRYRAMTLAVAVLAGAAALAEPEPVAACALYIPNVPAMRQKAEVIVVGRVTGRLADAYKRGPDFDFQDPTRDVTNQAYLFTVERVVRNRTFKKVRGVIQIETNFVDASESDCQQTLGAIPSGGERVRMFLYLDPETRSFYRMSFYEAF